MKSKNTLLKIIVNLDFIISSIAILLLILLTFLGVFFRYALNSPIHWQEEVQMMLFVWVTFLGGSVAVRTGSHVAIDIVVDLLPKSIQKIVEGCILLITLIVLGYLMTKSVTLINQLATSERLTNILQVPLASIYLVVPVGCVLMGINFCVTFYRKFFLNQDGEGVAIRD